MTDAIALLAGALEGRAAAELPVGMKRPAAVAAVLRDLEAGPELLFIHRVSVNGDPWSGHLAFPGGRIEAGDTSLRAAAERETIEELGLDLAEHRYLGRLDDITGATIPVVVAGFAYVLERDVALRPNHEVADAFWAPLATLCDAARHQQRSFSIQGDERVYPCVDLELADKPVLWGLTYRFVRQIAGFAGLPFGSADGRR